jgi:hypothetical protein
LPIILLYKPFKPLYSLCNLAIPSCFLCVMKRSNSSSVSAANKLSKVISNNSSDISKAVPSNTVGNSNSEKLQTHAMATSEDIACSVQPLQLGPSNHYSSSQLAQLDFLKVKDAEGNFSDGDYFREFERIAHELLNHHTLLINGTEFGLCEIEFYYYGNNHLDSFAHQHPIQLNFAVWYFHRQGTKAEANYKAASYKGLDLTFASSNGQAYAGILIRSIQNIKTKEIIEGSCLVVHKILSICGAGSIKQLIDQKLAGNIKAFLTANSLLQLVRITDQSKIFKNELHSSPRVGLTLKKAPTVEREKFIFKHYRFTLRNYFPTKQKQTVLLALAAKLAEKQGENKNFTQFIAEISKLSSSSNATVTGWLSEMNSRYNKFTKSTENKAALQAYYGEAFKAAQLSKAYAIWLKQYH